VVIKNLLVPQFFSLSPFFFSFISPAWWQSKPFLLPSCVIPSFQNGVLMGTHWELEWKILGTNGKNGKQSFLIRNEIWCNFIAQIFSWG
jgi:hypothetical protein